jgi:hypothetical protein
MKAMCVLLIGVVLSVGVPLFAQIKPCEELKGEIEGKLKEKGITGFSLEIVPADQVKDQKVVGSCGGGKNKIVYAKDAAKKEETVAPKKEK